MWNAASTCIFVARAYAFFLIAAAGLAFAPIAAADRKPPTNPSGLTITSATSTSVSLSWQKSTGRAVVGYRTYLDGSFVTVTKTTSYTFRNLRCGRSYSLGVQAYDDDGNRSAVVTIVAGTSPCVDTTAPTAPTALTQTGSTQTSLSLSWTASIDDVGVARYNLYVAPVVVASTAMTTYTFSGLECGRSYTLGVQGVDARGNVSPTAWVTAGTRPCPDTLAPTTPTYLMQTASTVGSVSLSWGASLDDVGLVGYGVYVNGTRIATTTWTSFAVVNLICGTTYALGVDAVDAAGNRSPAASVVAATAPCPAPAPTATTLTLAPTADARVEEAYPSANFGSSFLRVDGGADPRTESSLRFTVEGLAGSVTKASLQLYANTDTVDGPSVYGSGDSWSEGGVTWHTRPSRTSSPSGDAGAIAAGTWVVYDVSQLVRTSGTYNFTLATTSSDGVNFDSREGGHPPRLVLTTTGGTTDAQEPPPTGGATDTEPPTVPTALTQTARTASTISVAWAASTDNVGLAGYDVYVDGSKVGSTSGTSYTALSLTCGTRYTVAVDSHDAAGNRSSQAAIAAATSACSPSGGRWPANPFPIGSVYNPGPRIPANVAIHPNSANIVSFMLSTTTGGWKLVCCNWAQAIHEVDADDPVAALVKVGTRSSGDPARFGPVRTAPGTHPDASDDGHLSIIDYDRRTEVSFWQARETPDPNVYNYTCAQATTFDELNIGLRYCGANTANMPGSAGIIAPEEIQAGHIGHPLVLAAAAIRGDGNDHVCPAGGGWGESSNLNAPVAGQWIQMDPTLDVNALAIPSWQKTIVRALQEYGAFIRDQSANDTTFFGENPLNRPLAPSWGSLLGSSGNQLLSTAIPWHRLRVLQPPC